MVDAYDVAQYVVNYLSKSKGGMSELLRHTAKEAKAKNQTLKQQFRLADLMCALTGMVLLRALVFIADTWRTNS